MIVSVLAAGSRGDVQPPAALALALAARGHEAHLVAHSEFAGLVEGSAVVFDPLTGDIRAELDSPEARAFFAGGSNPLAFMRWLYAVARRYTAETTPLLRDYVAASDVIVGTGLMDGFGSVMGRHFNKPSVHAYMQPFLPTRDFPCAMMAPLPFAMPGWMNRLETHLYAETVWLSMRPLGKMMHRLLELPPPSLKSPARAALKAGEPFLMAYSQALLPRGSDWPANVDVTGYWFLDRPADWQAPPALAQFIESGPAPIYVGFGSMIMKDPAATLAAVLEAIRRNGCRAIISAGWGGMRPTDIPDHVFSVDSVPHDWLFPRMAAVVHHGGAGTTGSALRAGVPQVVVPFINDQFFWARRLEEHGVAPRGVRHSKLTGEALGAAIRRALGDGAMRRRAAEIGARVRSENGAARAAAIIERSAQSGDAKRSGLSHDESAPAPWRRLVSG